MTAPRDVYACAPDDPVLAELRGAVLLLTLNRPTKLNAWNDAMERGYFDLLEAADADPDVRAIVVTGAGRGFCAGADMANLQHVSERTEADLVRERPRDMPRQVRKPLIGAINGVVAGMALAQALHFDVRFGDRGARFTAAFPRRGLIAEYGTTVLLAQTVGRSRAADLLLSGRIVESDEALRIGLLDRLAGEGDNAVDAALTYARELAENCSPRSMAVIKQQLRTDIDDAADPSDPADPADPAGAASGYAAAAARADRLMLRAFHSPDAAEGVAAHLERRAPAFPSLPPRPAGETPASAAQSAAR